MNREDRAKQFMAFDALKGLQEELRKKEAEMEEENNEKSFYDDMKSSSLQS